MERSFYILKEIRFCQLWNHGSQLIIRKPLQEIKNSGNPGGFDYKRYCLFREITHQVYLKPNEFTILAATNKKWLTSFLDGIREKVLNILRDQY